MTRQFRRLAYTLYECKYHVVFCPKYRYKILQAEVAEYVTRQIHRLCEQKDGVEVVEVKVQPDHVRRRKEEYAQCEKVASVCL